MIKKILLGIVILIAMAVIYFTGSLIKLGMDSRKGNASGFTDAKLTHCPESPNCLNSEYADDTSHYTAPIDISGMSTEEVTTAATAIITNMGGTGITTNDNYIAATFSSNLFGFVDDLELRIDHPRLHIRSASRVGYGDMGVNAERVDAFKQLWAEYP